MISLEEARAIVTQQVQPLAPVRAGLGSALGRVLRDDVTAPQDLPAFDRSAMDGYALDAADPSPRFRVIGEIQPGAETTLRIGPGECARIFTGAAIPAGASQVVMQEDVQRQGEFITISARTEETHIRRRGEDARAGSVLLRAGTRLAPPELALLAQVGAVEPLVSPRVRALHFTTGNELVDPATQPVPGQIRDTNSTLIAALLATRGAEVVGRQRCRDSLDLLAGAIAAAPPETWDLLLISGGASVGDYDFGTRALERAGFQLHFPRINLRPGKPLVFATRDRQAAFVIPGNPVSHFVCFHLVIARAVECLQGAAEPWPLVNVALARTIDDSPCPRETWWPAHVSPRDATLTAEPLTWQSSGDLCGLAGANGLIRVPARTPMPEAGSEVACLLLG